MCGSLPCSPDSVAERARKDYTGERHRVCWETCGSGGGQASIAHDPECAIVETREPEVP